MTAKDCNPFRLAACREDLQDGKEWSLYALNDQSNPVEVQLTRLSYEWGDRGHSVAPMIAVQVAGGGHALLWREGWEGAEMNIEASVQVRNAGSSATLPFELGKLYRRRDPVPLAQLGKPGWLFVPAQEGK